jgi:hypothetical protein
MLLTEPEAGSDVGALTTTAVRNGDGTYAITGNKIFISSGEHDLAENIIHPVLARIEGAPEGTKGISLFLVPKIWVNDDGSYAAIGYKGQFIFVVPEINTVVVFTGDLAGGTFFIPMELMADYVIPSVTSSKSLPIDMEETTRLDSLVKRAALPVSEGFVWLSREEGFAQDGIFRRVQFPKFMFEYPKGSKKLATVSPAQIMRMKTPGEVQFAASVMDIPDNLKLEDFGPKLFTGILQNIGSDIQVIANNKLTLKCGTSAYRSDIKWVWNKVYPITSLVVSSFKNNKCIYLVANPIQNPEKFAPIVESLRFE